MNLTWCLKLTKYEVKYVGMRKRMFGRVLWNENVRMFAEWCSPNPDNLVLVRLIPAWFGSVWWFQWFLALIWSGLEIIFDIDIQICFNVNHSGELHNAKIVWKRFFGRKSEFLIGNSSFDRRTDVFIRFWTKTKVFDRKFQFWARNWRFCTKTRIFNRKF